MRAIVTGASPGIGGSTIRKLAQIANQKNEKLQIAACEIRLTDDLKSCLLYTSPSPRDE